MIKLKDIYSALLYHSLCLKKFRNILSDWFFEVFLMLILVQKIFEKNRSRDFLGLGPQIFLISQGY